MIRSEQEMALRGIGVRPKPLDGFLLPICSGLTQSGGGGLSRERAAQLDDQLRELALARGRAEAELRGLP